VKRAGSYAIVERSTPLLLERAVLDLMAEGWQPQGGPFTAPWTQGHGYGFDPGSVDPADSSRRERVEVNFCQALVRRSWFGGAA
jgi:hypothetical protein